MKTLLKGTREQDGVVISIGTDQIKQAINQLMDGSTVRIPTRTSEGLTEIPDAPMPNVMVMATTMSPSADEIRFTSP